MAPVLGFLVSALASLLDPLSLIGYVAAGILVRHYWVSILSAIVWRLALQVALVATPPRSLQSQAAGIPVAALAGAAFATSLIYLIARALRSGLKESGATQSAARVDPTLDPSPVEASAAPAQTSSAAPGQTSSAKPG